MTTALTGAAEQTGARLGPRHRHRDVTLDPAAGTVCYDLTVTLSPPAAAAHIHRGAADASGPVVVPFDAPTTGTHGCAQGVDPALVAEIMGLPPRSTSTSTTPISRPARSAASWPVAYPVRSSHTPGVQIGL